MSHSPFPWREAFLEALREMPIFTHACRVVGIDRSTAFRARQADPEFAAAVEDAMETGIDRAEQEAFRRAVEGWQEPVIDKGRLAYAYERYVDPETSEERYRPILDKHGQPIPLTVRKHSDQLLTLILKGRRKRVYADRTELTGADGGPVETTDTERAARIAHLLELARARKDAEDLA